MITIERIRKTAQHNGITDEKIIRFLEEILSEEQEWLNKLATKEDIEKLDVKLERTVTKEELKLVIEMFDKRFEAVDKRFEAVDKRFEDLNKRFIFLQWLIVIGFTFISILITYLNLKH